MEIGFETLDQNIELYHNSMLLRDINQKDQFISKLLKSRVKFKVTTRFNTAAHGILLLQ